MKKSHNAATTIADADAAIADALRSLQTTTGFFSANAKVAGDVLRERRQRREESLRRFVFDRIASAQQRPPLGGEEITPDVRTRLARQVRRKHASV